MPFYDDAGIPHPQAPAHTTDGVVLEWLVAERSWVQSGDRIARVQVGDKRYVVRIGFPAVVQRLRVGSGQHVRATEAILTWAADGESIPPRDRQFELVPESDPPH